MAVLAGDTWGIPGPTFIVIYLMAAAVAVVLTLTLRWGMSRGRPAGRPLRPAEMAYLAGGEQQAVVTALAALHQAGAIETAGTRGLQVAKGAAEEGSPSAGSDRLADAALRAVRKRPTGSIWTVTASPGVRDEVEQLRDGLVRDGLLLARDVRSQWRLTASPLWVVLAAGIARLMAGLYGDKPVGYLFLVLIALGVTTAVMMRSFSLVTRAGRAALAGLRTEHRHLDPEKSPAWNTYGSDSIVTATALFGTEALWSAERSFAKAMQLEERISDYRQLSKARRRRFATGGGGGFYVGSGGSSCSGGSSGGGGGCGGGGGGGGGGGCGG